MANYMLSHQPSDPHDPDRPPDSEIRDQIDRIIRSKPFLESVRLRRFLIWTVNQVLQGDVETIKQFTVAQEVFDRGAQFDPRIDSIVRTEAKRLRRKLTEYYRGEGLADSILVSFEAGSYVPVLKTRQRALTPRQNKKLEVMPEANRRPATAVMPFVNLTGYADQDYFCRGIAESIQERLANLPSLKVISSYSSFRFAAETKDFTKIGLELGVNTIVEGSVQLLGLRIRIYAKVVDVTSGIYIWAKLFDREMQNLFAIQDEIARAVADAVTGQSTAEPRSGIAGSPSTDVYRHYLRGRHFWNKVTVQGCEEAVRCFVRTISLAPEYGAGYAALAEAYHWLIFLGARSISPLIPTARRLALQALRLDRHCSEAYIALAISTAVFERRWNEAELLFRRGLELRPNYVPGYLQRALCHLELDHIEESRCDIEKALDLDPLSARSHRGAGLRFYLLRDFTKAIVSFDRALELGPDIENTHYFRGLALLQLGRTDDAITALVQSVEPAVAGARLGALVVTYAAGGYRTKADEALQNLHQQLAMGFASPTAFVQAYAGLGQTSTALDWLERAAYERYTGLMQLKLNSLYDSLRDEPRFQAVLRRTNLE